MGCLGFVTTQALFRGEQAPFAPMLWRAHEQRRKTASTLVAEVIAAGEGVGNLDWIRASWEECCRREYQPKHWERYVSTRPSVILTDCKSVYDALSQAWTSSSKSDKRTSIDLALIRETLRRDSSQVRWIDTKNQLVDSMTKKSASADLLRRVMLAGKYQIMEERDALDLRVSLRTTKAS